MYEVVLVTGPEHGEGQPGPRPDLLHPVSVLCPRGEGHQAPLHWPHLLTLVTSPGLKQEPASITGLLQVDYGGDVNEGLLKNINQFDDCTHQTLCIL